MFRPHKKGASEKIPQPGEFNNVFSGQDGADERFLWGGMDLIQVMLRCGLGHELPYAFVKSAISYQIGTGTPRLADALVFEWMPFSENCGTIKIDLNVSISHPQRFAFFFPAALRPAHDPVFFAPDFFAAFFDAFVAVFLAVFFFVDFFADS
jgi:hypothetical protein